jgi:HEAT repeat protein
MMRIGFIALLICRTLAAEETPAEAAWATITDGVNSPNAIKRKDAISTLDAAGLNPRIVGLLETALSDKDVVVRQTAASVLGALKSRQSIPKLRAALQDPAPEVSFSAATALWNMKDPSGRDIFAAVAAGERGNSSGIMKEQIRDAKKKLHSPGTLAMMGIRESAGAFLGPFAMGLTVFDELRKDSSASARTLSLSMLSTDTDPKTIKAIEDALEDKNWIVRTAAAKALAVRNSRDSVPKLRAALVDKHESVRYMAAAAIVKLTTPVPPPVPPPPSTQPKKTQRPARAKAPA